MINSIGRDFPGIKNGCKHLTLMHNPEQLYKSQCKACNFDKHFNVKAEFSLQNVG